jgi:hypothetical protein
MHTRIAKYTSSGNAEEIARKADEGILPTFKSMPAFKAYLVIESEGEIFSFSGWETEERADQANIAVADWVAERTWPVNSSSPSRASGTSSSPPR